MTREQPDRPTREIQEEVNKEFGPDETRAGYWACTLNKTTQEHLIKGYTYIGKSSFT